jgi:hypothetical protein
MNLHALVLYGRDDHHKAEALFKALGRALAGAVALNGVFLVSRTGSNRAMSLWRHLFVAAIYLAMFLPASLIAVSLLRLLSVSGLTALSKWRDLGVFTPSSDEARGKVQADRDEIDEGIVEMMDRAIPCGKTEERIRAVAKASPMDPAGVRKYLAGKFKETLPEVEAKLVALSETFPPEELNAAAMDAYMRLRPNVPKGREGWGKAACWRSRGSMP